MRASILENLIAFQQFSASFDRSKVGHTENYSWVLNQPNHWPSAIVGLPKCSELKKVAHLIDQGELPPYIIAPTLEIENCIIPVKQCYMREVLRWDGMFLNLDEYCATESPIDGFVVNSVEDEAELCDWYSIVNQVLMENKIISEYILNGYLLDRHSCLLLGYFEGKPVATGMLYLKNGVSGLYFIATLPNYQGKGFATALVKKLIQQSSTMGAKEIVLHASTAGRRLYHNLGFKSSADISTYWKLGVY